MQMDWSPRSRNSNRQAFYTTQRMLLFSIEHSLPKLEQLTGALW
jgi:hypothetical protein